MNIMSEYKCPKCKETFSNEYNYTVHLNKTVPCDYRCKNCGKQYSRAGYYKHRKKCTPQEENINPQLINIDSSINSTTNSNNVIQNTTNNLNNMVMMVPFGLEHRTTLNNQNQRETVMGGIKGLILDLVRKGKIDEAYEILFKQIHGNSSLPQYHNIYMEPYDNNNICIFGGEKFVLADGEKYGTKLYGFLRMEMDWAIGMVCNDIDEIGKLKCDLDYHWRHTVMPTDITMQRMLRNNKSVVNNTIENNEVWPDLIAMSKYTSHPIDIIPKNGTVKMF